VRDKKRDKADATNPGTEAFVPDFSDDDDAENTGDTGNTENTENTGTHSWVPDFGSDVDHTGEQPVAEQPAPPARPAPPADPAEPAAEEESEAESAGIPVQSVTVPGRYLYVKWWKLALVLLGIWAVAAVVGSGLFYWWHHSIDKTPALFVVLVYVVVCVVGGVMLAMVEGRPLVSALSVAVMSAPFGAFAAAAPLYGYYHCSRVGHCLAAVIPY
jgi:hypothetical protein